MKVSIALEYVLPVDEDSVDLILTYDPAFSERKFEHFINHAHVIDISLFGVNQLFDAIFALFSVVIWSGRYKNRDRFSNTIYLSISTLQIWVLLILQLHGNISNN